MFLEFLQEHLDSISAPDEQVVDIERPLSVTISIRDDQDFEDEIDEIVSPWEENPVPERVVLAKTPCIDFKVTTTSSNPSRAHSADFLDPRNKKALIAPILPRPKTTERTIPVLATPHLPLRSRPITELTPGQCFKGDIGHRPVHFELKVDDAVTPLVMVFIAQPGRLINVYISREKKYPTSDENHWRFDQINHSFLYLKAQDGSYYITIEGHESSYEICAQLVSPQPLKKKGSLDANCVDLYHLPAMDSGNPLRLTLNCNLMTRNQDRLAFLFIQASELTWTVFAE